MNFGVIAVVLQRLAGIYIWVVMVLVYVVVPASVIIYLIGLGKRLRNIGREWKLFRIEFSKLADQVEQIQKQLKQNSSD